MCESHTPLARHGIRIVVAMGRHVACPTSGQNGIGSNALLLNVLYACSSETTQLGVLLGPITVFIISIVKRLRVLGALANMICELQIFTNSMIRPGPYLEYSIIPVGPHVSQLHNSCFK